MTSTKHYRIETPTISVMKDGDQYVAHTVPAGAMIEANQEIFQDGAPSNELIEVVCDGRAVKMFREDLRSRATAQD